MSYTKTGILSHNAKDCVVVCYHCQTIEIRNKLVLGMVALFHVSVK